MPLGQYLNEIHPTLLLLLPSLIGLGALTAGIYSLLNPQSASRLYGVSCSPSASSTTSTISFPDLLSFLDEYPSSSSIKRKQTSSRTSSSKDVSRSSLPSQTSQNDGKHSHITLHYPLAVRNISTGLMILFMTAYWQAVLTNPALPDTVSDTLQHVLGDVILVGSFVPFVDAWVCWRAGGRRATCLHVGRGIVWIGSGILLSQSHAD